VRAQGNRQNGIRRHPHCQLRQRKIREGGITLLLVTMTGVLGANQAAAIGSIAAVLGGIVSFGSNVGTLQQTTDAIGAAELAVQT
jgi:hypothetical protein